MNLQNQNKKILTIPNFLSLLRLLMVPCLFWLYCGKQDYIATLVLLIISGLTDIADGFIARRFNMVSDFGKVFDPIADKLTQIVMMICLVTRFRLMLLPLSFLVIKEVFASVTGIMAIKKTGEVKSAAWHGKAATALIYGIVAVHIIWFDINSAVSSFLILACTVMMVISAIMYGIERVRIIIGK